MPFLNTSPLIDPGAAEPPCAEAWTTNGGFSKRIAFNARMAAPPGQGKCNTLPKSTAPGAISSNTLRKQGMH